MKKPQKHQHSNATYNETKKTNEFFVQFLFPAAVHTCPKQIGLNPAVPPTPTISSPNTLFEDLLESSSFSPHIDVSRVY